MKLEFYKYQGTGNDFIIIDNRQGNIDLDEATIAHLCNRHFGIGADGLMLLKRVSGYDFGMLYYNSDGRMSSMCGNGGRCIAAFASRIGIIYENASFLAIDGAHVATINQGNNVSLEMRNVTNIVLTPEGASLFTGSPHLVFWVDDIDTRNVVVYGRRIRNMPDFQPDGINVNVMQRTATGLKVRTYERGVEDETLSCGTGVTAAAIASVGKDTGRFQVKVETLGGMLEVSFNKRTPDTASDIILSGAATFVFNGVVKI